LPTETHFHIGAFDRAAEDLPGWWTADLRQSRDERLDRAKAVTRRADTEPLCSKQKRE